MKYAELFTSPSLTFLATKRSVEEADLVVLGFPYDRTSFFRTGSRLGPKALREASLGLEDYSVRTDVSEDELRICDLGDLDVVDDLSECLRRLELVARELFALNKRIAVLGGEHSLALGVARALGKGSATLIFDAHLDLRDELLGSKLCHATFARRLSEEAGPSGVILVGTRAACKEDLRFAREAGIRFVTASALRHDPSKAIAEISDAISPFDRVHLSIDLDVLDPAVAPAVCCPEPEGLSVTQLLDILQSVFDRRFAAVDLCELTPIYDHGTTACVAAKILFEILCLFKKATG